MNSFVWRTILVILLAATTSFAQPQIDHDDIVGVWKFEAIHSEIDDCSEVNTFPIVEMEFTESMTFSMSAGGDRVIGDYKFIHEQIIRFYDVLKNGKPEEEDEELKLTELQNGKMAFELSMECGLVKVIFKKQ